MVSCSALPESVASTAEAYGHCKFEADKAVRTNSLANNPPHCKSSRGTGLLPGDASLEDAEGISICSFQFKSIPFLFLRHLLCLLPATAQDLEHFRNYRGLVRIARCGFP